MQTIPQAGAVAALAGLSIVAAISVCLRLVRKESSQARREDVCSVPKAAVRPKAVRKNGAGETNTSIRLLFVTTKT